MKGQFAMVMDGLDLASFPFNGAVGTLARVGAVQFNGTGKLTLAELANDSLTGSGAQGPGGLSGAYPVSANGRATGTLTGSNGGLTLVKYTAAASDANAVQAQGFSTTPRTV